MKITNYDFFNATNYFTLFESDKEDMSRLMKYITLLIENEVSTKIVEHPKYSPSNAWKEWLAGNYICFSDSRIMVKSGHKLYNSYNPAFTRAYRGDGSRLKELIGFMQRLFFLDKQRPEDIHEAYRKFYHGFEAKGALGLIMKHHPGAFFRSSECVELLGDADRKVVLEVGAGAGTSPLINYFRFKSRNVIVDLPETISFAFIMVRTFAPEAQLLLPNELDTAITDKELQSKIQENDFLFLLPTQVDLLPEGFASAALNVSSFQEMDIDVVRNYIDFFTRVYVLVDGWRCSTWRYQGKSLLTRFMHTSWNALLFLRLLMRHFRIGKSSHSLV